VGFPCTMCVSSLSLSLNLNLNFIFCLTWYHPYPSSLLPRMLCKLTAEQVRDSDRGGSVCVCTCVSSLSLFLSLSLSLSLSPQSLTPCLSVSPLLPPTLPPNPPLPPLPRPFPAAGRGGRDRVQPAARRLLRGRQGAVHNSLCSHSATVSLSLSLSLSLSAVHNSLCAHSYAR
jgi:hypothetical protein